MDRKLIDAIKDAEAKADKIISNAESKAAELVSEAKTEALTSLNKSDQERRKYKDKKIAQFEDEAGNAAAKISEIAEKQAVIEQGKARKNMPQAVELIVSEVLESV